MVEKDGLVAMPRFLRTSAFLSISDEDRTEAEFAEAIAVLEEALRTLRGKGWKPNLSVWMSEHVEAVDKPRVAGTKP